MKFVFSNVEAGKSLKTIKNYFFKTKSKPACMNIIYSKTDVTNRQHYLYGTIKKEKYSLLKFRPTISVKQAVSKKFIQNGDYTIKNKSSIISKIMDKQFSYIQQQFVDFVLFYLLNSYLLIRTKAHTRYESIHSVKFTSPKRTRPRTWFEMNAINEHGANIIEHNYFVSSLKKHVSFWKNSSNFRCANLLC